jgi:hypothetical protein
MNTRSNILIAKKRIEGSIKLVLGTLGFSVVLIAFILLVP